MKQLIWKEYREKRWWFLPVALFPMTCALTRWGYTFVGFDGPTSAAMPQATLSGMIALLMGLSGYAPELGGRTVDFLYAKPIGWKRVLIAKAAVALAIIFASVVLAAIVYRLSCPAPYLPFATLPVLAKGAAVGALFMIGGHLLGLCCSVALPGMLGSVLTFASVVAAFAVAESVFVMLGGPRLPGITYFFVFLAAGLALILSALVVARFGLTLSLGPRVRKFLVVFLVGLASGSVAASYLGHAFQPRWAVESAAWQFSPSGEYVYMRVAPDRRMMGANVTLRIWRLSDSASGEFRGSGGYGSGGEDSFWTADNKVFVLSQPRVNRPLVLRLLWLDKQGALRAKELALSEAFYASVWPSPSRKWAIVMWNWRRPDGSEHTERAIVDLRSLQLTTSKLPAGADSLDWVSESVLSYRVEGQKTPLHLSLGP